MGNATQLAGGPLLGTNIPPGMSYNAATAAWTFSGAVSIGGAATITGNLEAKGTSHILGATGNNDTFLYIRAAVAKNRELRFQTDGSIRSSFGVDGTAESGADAGSVIVARAYTDAGAQVDVWLSMPRASGSTLTLCGSTRRTLATTGGRVRAFDIVTDTVNLNSTHNVVVCNKGTAMTVNLPAVATNAGREYIIKNKGAGVVTVDANASELIDSATTQTLNQWQSTHLVCDGTIWVIV